MKRSTRFLALVFSVFAIVAGAACSRERTDSAARTEPATPAAGEERAMVRVVNAAPATKQVDAYAGDERLFDGVEYKTVTDYKEVKDERLTVSVRPAGSAVGEPLAKNSEGLSAGEHYTFVVVPETDQNKVTLLAMKDDLDPADNNKAKVRVVNASRSAGEVDIFVQGSKDPLVSGLNFQSESFYSEVDPRTANLEIRQEGKTRPLTVIKDVNFEAGKHYTFVVAGTGNRVEAIRIEDQTGAGHAARRGSQ